MLVFGSFMTEITKRALILLTFICTGVPALAEGPRCVEIFSNGTTPLGAFSEIDFRHFREPDGATRYHGAVILTGQDRETKAWIPIGSVEYKIAADANPAKGAVITLTRLIERPEFYGQGVYNRMIEAILEKNLALNVKSIVISLSGPFFRQYRDDLARLGNEEAALAANPVYKQLSSLGFTKIGALFELSNTQQVFLHLSLER
jgi:hypothetical protein